MATATDSDTYAKELKELVAFLSPGPRPLAQLPKSLQEPAFLDFALSEGRIMVGRPDHSWERKIDASESPEARPIGMKIHKTIGWTTLDKEWHKTIFELLQEEETIDAGLKLQVKLSRRTK
jgi:hypothetical protein